MSTQDDIDDFNRRLIAALDAQDVNGVLDCYTEDGALLAPGGPAVVGREALGQWWKTFFDNGFRSAEMTTDRIVEDQPALVVELGSYRMELTGPDGQPIRDEGKYSIVYRRGPDDRLRYAVDSLSSSLA
ncbi:nuclear transport factor 2 family protein [Gordonia sp. OPL2]|uniref:YybH family protein n=1 Tax=Gordonia sp. OPL2 TaxID=2486274 RepID=UPI0016551383|nr:nuclear transport factor 2 family protein [Gordonia sp. OPL2]ROZ99079.1 DUF4440 domain-containing protein [Gordonia sp. OPL2]